MTKGNQCITLEFTGYTVKGLATLTLWGGGTGRIEMHPYQVENLEDSEIFENANDSGFGCVSIDAIEVDIYENYEGYLVYLDSKTIKKEDLK